MMVTTMMMLVTLMYLLIFPPHIAIAVQFRAREVSWLHYGLLLLLRGRRPQACALNGSVRHIYIWPRALRFPFSQRGGSRRSTFFGILPTLQLWIMSNCHHAEGAAAEQDVVNAGRSSAKRQPCFEARNQLPSAAQQRRLNASLVLFISNQAHSATAATR